MSAPEPFYASADGRFRLFQGDCLEVLPALGLAGAVDLVVADPPYFLSAGGTTCRSGKRVPVDKGAWDRPGTVDEMHEFNRRWLAACLEVLHEDGALWASGTHHSIHSVAFAIQQLGMRILNEVAWEKPAPPPNLGCRSFTHSTETLIWAAKSMASRYRFNYAAMKAANGGKQMKTVWRMGAAPTREKTEGRHPAQKPQELMERILLACTGEGDLVLDPFSGSGTTGIAAARLGRRFVGIELDPEYLALAVRRLEALASLSSERCSA